MEPSSYDFRLLITTSSTDNSLATVSMKILLLQLQYLDGIIDEIMNGFFAASSSPPISLNWSMPQAYNFTRFMCQLTSNPKDYESDQPSLPPLP
jgi:hypothetical protein